MVGVASNHQQIADGRKKETAMTTNRNSLDRVLADLDAELERRISELESIGHKAKSMLHKGEKQEKAEEKRMEVLEVGKDDNGDPINPDIGEALDWLESEGVVDMEDFVDGIQQIVDEGVGKLKAKLHELRGIAKDLAPGSFRKAQNQD